VIKMSAFWNDHPLVQALLGAFVVGLVGSSAYLTVLLLGFLGDAPIQQLRPRFEIIRGNPPAARLSRARLALFAFFGGGIALVFQWAQGVVFTPIQALVLGSTWPTIISQFIARAGETEADKIRDLADRIAGGQPTTS
jgi:hypothetical protein